MELKVLTAALVLTGALLWLLPTRPPDASALPLPMRRSALNPGPAKASSDSSAVAAIIASNIFSASRAAPHSRYVPPGAGGAEAEPAGAQPDPSASLLSSPPPRVFGTMMGPGGASALMQADSAGASGRLYREGDRVGAYRIVKISGSSVVVSGPDGRVELRIQPREDRTQ